MIEEIRRDGEENVPGLGEKWRRIVTLPCRWSNPQSRRQAAMGDQSRTHSNPQPKENYTKITAEISEIAHQKVATLAPPSPDPDRGARQMWTIPSICTPDRATAPRIPFLPAQSCNRTPQIRKPPHQSKPNPRSTTEITVGIAGRNRARTGRSRTSNAPRSNWRSDL